MDYLADKYIIIKDGDNDKIIYLESTGTRRGIYVTTWTDDIKHARGFDDYTEARVKCGNLLACSNLKDSNPRVRYMDKNFSLKIPKEDRRYDESTRCAQCR
jgi:hypothetical protein